MEPNKLLIVDDNENNLFTFSQILETPNRELTCVSSGKEALAALMRDKYSLVLMDVQMPGMDGFKTAKIMHSMSEERVVPIIFISAVYKTPEFIEQGFELGAFDYITKPVDAYLLQNKVKAFLHQARQGKRLETLNQQLEANNRGLEDRVRSRTREIWLKHRQLEDMVSRLKTRERENLDSQERLKSQDRLATLGTMAAGVAHELKNPLNFILNFANIINDLAEELREWKTDLDQESVSEHARSFDEIVEDLTSSTQMVHQQGLRADGIIQSILKSAHVQRETPAPTDINALLQEALHLASLGSDSLNTEIETAYCETLPQISVVSSCIVRVFLNLASNAFYALAIKKKRLGDAFIGKIKLGSFLENGWVVATLEDNGDGIPKEKLSQIFDPFFTTKPPGEGTGLGLYLSHDIVVKEHEGKFEVNSTEGQGVKFSISLPVDSPSDPAP